MKSALSLSFALLATVALAGALAPAQAQLSDRRHQEAMPGFRTTRSGLQFKDEVAGNGPQPRLGRTVVVNYTGWLMNGQKFDSSFDRNQPFTFPLGMHQVIAGWDEGVATMRVGGTRILIIPPELGYGAAGTPGGPIPPNATLKFKVELLGVK
jgi:FKBP-type peptidyl-prolyl cis-trans isomerase